MELCRRRFHSIELFDRTIQVNEIAREPIPKQKIIAAQRKPKNHERLPMRRTNMKAAQREAKAAKPPRLIERVQNFQTANFTNSRE
jgi:hypothetical protein